MNKIDWAEASKYGVQYLGRPGFTNVCLFAIDAIVNSRRLPEMATIVSTPPYSENERLDHLFIFWNWYYFPVIVVPSGFASGYSGQGPKGFSLAICMIRDKGIPINGTYIDEDEFDLINKGKIRDIHDPLLQKIRLESELYTWPWPEWVSDEDEELLERGQLWRKFLWREPKVDWLTEAIADVDLYRPGVGKKLRLAVDKLKSEDVEEWQSVGILMRDAWIELMQTLCQEKNIDTSGIRKDRVTQRLAKLKLDERVLNFMKSAFDLSQKIHHDTKIDLSIPRACVMATALAMQTLISPEIQKRNKAVK